MGTEIERKFLVTGHPWQGQGEGKLLRQGYLCYGPPVAVRVRIGGGKAILNEKKATVALTRDEFEYPIPIGDGEAILEGLCAGELIEKTRYIVPYANMQWEIDVFHGANAGLVVAELELEQEDQPFQRPDWLGEEVSHDARYLNSSLSQRPYSTW